MGLTFEVMDDYPLPTPLEDRLYQLMPIAYLSRDLLTGKTIGGIRYYYRVSDHTLGWVRYDPKHPRCFWCGKFIRGRTCRDCDDTEYY